ncbi:MAG TPA: DUF86 domain-containing protein [Phycisphaerae bacterium]|nr:DUF86 domain-containing protein [Phycisphaerae bacterium]
MSKRDDRISLQDMLDHSREAINLVGNLSFEEFSHNRVLQLAITRLVEIVGEATNRVSQNTKQAYSTIPWPQIIGMRNRLVHGYDVIDFELLWGTVKNDLPPLVEALVEIVEK